LPWEMQSDSRRIMLQKDLSSKDLNDGWIRRFAYNSS
jgi:hypothetical protein